MNNNLVWIQDSEISTQRCLIGGKCDHRIKRKKK